MIEPFEFEPIKLYAKPMETSHSSVADTRLDQSVADSILPLDKSSNEITLEHSQNRVYQTKLSDASMWNTHQAAYVLDRLVQKDTEQPTSEHMSLSRRFNQFLDTKASFVPNIDKHIPPTFQVISPDEPCFSPGLTSIDRHKYVSNIK